jgi:hypothetical protein
MNPTIREFRTKTQKFVRIPETQTCSLPLYLNEGERSSITELDNESSQKMTTLLIPGVGWDQKEVESK